jgi:fatty acid desaturase
VALDIIRHTLAQKGSHLMRGSGLATALIVVGIVCILIAIYYIIPGIPHPFTFSPSNESHPTHALAFLAVGVLALIGSRFARNAA